VFVAAARAPSFSQAADTLGVSLAAVSMQIKALEEYLLIPLFIRHGRTVRLTADGERLLPRIERALGDLEQAIDAARLERRTGALTITMLSSFLQQWLLPRLTDFRARHPQVDLRFDTSPALVDFIDEDVQVALRFGTGRYPPLHSEKLLDDWLVPVCTEALLERHGPVSTQKDLDRYPLLHSKTETWDEWLDGKARDEWGLSGASFDDSVAVIRAAQAGQGLALARWSLVSNDIGPGRLAVASRRITPMEKAYYFVCPNAFLSLDKVAVFRAWVLEQARAASRPAALS
jgi:LysR family glycine cleavage system transcriptional activator